MALERDPAHLGDIGDRDPDPEPDPDWIYERRVEKDLEEKADKE